MRYASIRIESSWKRTVLIKAVALSIGVIIAAALGWGVQSPAFGTAGAIWQASTPEQEPNDAISQANPLALPAQRTGNVKYGDAAVYEFVYNNGPRDKIEDFFSFTVPDKETRRLDITLTFANAAADVDLFLFRKGSGDVLTEPEVSSGSTTTERIAPIQPLTKGDYIIGVSAYDDPDNTASTSYTLSVTFDAPSPPPVIASLNPVSAIAGGGAFSLTVNGDYFIAGESVVRWNGNPRTTIFITGQQVVAFLSAADIAVPGTAQVTVVNPPSLGGSSAAVNFPVLPPETPELEVEPNNTSAQANLLLAPGKRSGAVAVGDAAQVTINLNNGLSDPVEDLFAVNLAESKRLDLQLKGTNPDADLALYLLQEGGLPVQLTPLGNSRFRGPNQQITTPSPLPAGRYLVGVSGVTGSSNYTIEARVPGDRLLQVMTSSAAPDSTVTVPLTFFAEGNENVMTFSLGFDPAVLGNPQFLAGADMANAQVSLNQTQVGQGRLGIEIRLPQGQSLSAGLREIGRLLFQIKPGAGVNTTTIDFLDQPVVRTLYDVDNKALIGSYAGGTVIVVPGVEADVSPRPNGSLDNKVTIADWTQVGRFVAGLDATANGSEFQRADCAPKSTLGDGRLTITDWVQGGKYASGLEATVPAGGPSTPAASAGAFGDAVKINLVAAGEEAAQQQARTLRVKEGVFLRNRENELVVELVAEGNEAALGFSLNFDLSQLTYVDAVLGTDAAGAVLNINTKRLAEGRIGFALAFGSDQVFAPGVREALKITFAVPASSSVNSTTISFGDIPIIREVSDAQANVLATTYKPGVIQLDPPVNLIPSLTGLDPGIVLVGGSSFTLTVNGNNFIDGATVLVNGVVRSTTFLGATQLQTTISAADIAETGLLEITVRNPAPGGGISNSLNLSVINPTPRLDSLSPDFVGVGSVGITLTVNGGNFVRGAVVEFKGNNRLTNFVSDMQLTAQIPASDLATAETVSVRVINPEPGGGPSGALSFAIKPINPLPRITAISPASVQAGGGAFNLTVNGTNFVNGAVVKFNGEALTTSFVGNTELSALVEAERIAAPGTAQISVTNPLPGGGNSGVVLLTISVPPNPVPVLSSLSPSIVTARSPSFTLTLKGIDFIASSVARVNGADRATVFVSSTELKATILAEDILNGGSLAVKVFNPAPGGGSSNESVLTIDFASPQIVQLSPSSVVAGGPAFTLSVIGNNFAPGSVIRWNNQDRPTTYLGVGELTTQIAAAEIQNVGTAEVSVFSPPPGGGNSNIVTFSIDQAARPLPRIVSLSPESIGVASSAFTLIVNGTNFALDSVVRWNGANRPTAFIDSTQLKAEISAAEIAQMGTVPVTVFTPPPGGGLSNAAIFTITEQVNPAPSIASLSPSSVLAGGPAFTLTIDGAGFVPASTAQINGFSLTVAYVGANRLTAQVPASLIVAADTLPVSVTNPAPGGGTSNAVPLTITNPTPTIATLSPSAVAEGSPSFILTIGGSGLVPGVQAVVNGVPRQATYVNSSQATTQIAAAEVESAGTLTIQVRNPEPGGGISNSLLLSIRSPNPLPRLTRITPTEVNAGGSSLILVVEGIRFQPDSVVRVNGQSRTTEFVSETVLTTQIQPADIAAAGSLLIAVFTPAPGGGLSNAATLTVVNAAPRITTISPTTAGIGSPGIELIVFGEGFSANSAVRFNGADVPTTLVTGSQLTAQVPASLLAVGGTVPVTVFNPPPGGGTSNAVNFTIINPVPSIGGLSPSQVAAGGASFTLTVSGSGFLPGSIVRVNGQDRQTTYIGSTQLTVSIMAADIASGGTVNVSVFNPAPGGGISNLVGLPVINPLPSLLGLSPSAAAAGSPGFTLAVNGLDFVPASVVQWNGAPRPTTYVNSTRLTALIDSADLASIGTAAVTVSSPAPGGGISNPLVFAIVSQPNPVPTLTSLDPSAALEGDPGLTLTVTGTGFVAGATVFWNGAARPTTYLGATQLTIPIDAADLAAPGTFGVKVINPGPGGGPSNELPFTVDPVFLNCQTACMQSATYYQNNLNRLPRGAVWINGTSYVIANSISVIRRALEIGDTPQQQLTREFTATQLSVAARNTPSVNNSALSCYNLVFSPVALSNGAVISRRTSIIDLFLQARLAINDRRDNDLVLLTAIFQLLNGNDPQDRCR